ncbi:putative PI31 proteasome regulator, proteasome inhibitor PI31 [Septoria linicola]|nr:putative PI31 proteasome regulator, proteasome inhibitor PI31 [Septoria linicola]
MADSAPINALSGGTISEYMLASFPTNSSPQLRNGYDAIALAAHASMLAVGFRLVGLGEDHRIDATSDHESPQPLPTEWNASSGSYAFRYKHSQSSMEYLVKVSRMGNKAIIMAMGVGDDRTHTVETKVEEYISAGNLPLELHDSQDKDAKREDIIASFINVGRLSDFGSLMRVKLIQKLVPGIQKAGYEEEEESQAAEGSNRQPAPGRDVTQPQYDPLREERDPPATPYPLQDPLVQPRRGPLPDPMPGFDDEYEVSTGPRGMMPGGRLGRYGERDLYPQGLGPNDPMRGGIGPGLGGGFGGGGMHPTFDDPLFAGQGQQGGRRGQAPPGARYDDPFGPGSGGQGGHPRGAGMGGRPPNPFGGFGDGDFI